MAAEPLQYSRERFDGGAVTSGEAARNTHAIPPATQATKKLFADSDKGVTILFHEDKRSLNYSK